MKYLLLLIPFIATMWVPFYASGKPVVFGVPYFYWYQLLWVIISAILTALIYWLDQRRKEEKTE